jgi:predicted TIM-barrel fold metal-dependent hydrolase
MQNPKVIDADGHIYENHEEIEEYFEGKYRGMRRARAYPLFPSLDGWPRGLGAGRPDKVTETRPEDVIKFVDNMGLESTVLYPTAGLAIGLVQNPDWACSIARAYNNWFHVRYIKKDSRLKGVAILPVQDPQGAVEELRHAVEKLDMVGAFLPSATVMSKALGHPDFHPIFREAEALGVPLGVHGAPSRGFGFDYFRRPGASPCSGAPFSAHDPVHEHRLRWSFRKVPASEDRFSRSRLRLAPLHDGPPRLRIRNSWRSLIPAYEEKAQRLH